MKRPIHGIIAAATLLLGVGTASAGGFSIYEAGARATALGCAFTATADDGSALFYNTAGLSYQPGTHADINLIPLTLKIKFRGATPPLTPPAGETIGQTFLLPTFGVTHHTGGKLAVGLGLYAPFGLGVEWRQPESWVGRFTSYDVDLQTLYLSPAVSYQVVDNLAISAGLDVAWQHIELNRYAGQPAGGDSEWTNFYDVDLEGTSDLNVTPAFGLMARPHPRVRLGAMYHFEKDMKFTGGDGTLTNVAPEPFRDAAETQLAALGGSSYDIATTVGLPHILSLGAAFQAADWAWVEFNAVHFSWSNFEELRLDFDPDPTGQLSSVIPEEYEDVWQYRLGVDLDVAPRWKLMGGVVKDNSPQPKASISPLLPDADRTDWSFGVQHRLDRWTFTVSTMFVLNEERNNIVDGEAALFPHEEEDPETRVIKTREAGSYTSHATIVAFGVGYSF